MIPLVALAEENEIMINEETEIIINEESSDEVESVDTQSNVNKLTIKEIDGYYYCFEFKILLERNIILEKMEN